MCIDLVPGNRGCRLQHSSSGHAIWMRGSGMTHSPGSGPLARPHVSSLARIQPPPVGLGDMEPGPRLLSTSTEKEDGA